MIQEQKDLISNTHPCYNNLQSQRDIIADVRGGTLALRAKANQYLPKFPAELDSTYKARLATATLFNLYKKTEAVMAGLVFQNEVEIKESSIDEAIFENIDNKGNHLNIFLRQVFEKSFDGATVILVDAPNTKASDLGQQKSLGLKPYWVCYDHSCVTNWRYTVNPQSKKTELSLIVLKEVSNDAKGEYLYEEVTRYRKFVLNNQTVSFELWREIKDKNGKVSFILEAASNLNSKITEIPIAIVGCLDDSPPLLDLALLNIKHYQKESNFDNLEFMAGCPLFFTKGYEGKDDLLVGSDLHYKLTESGDIGWAQIDANGFAELKDSLKMLLEQMSLIGLSQLADKQANIDLTATEALLKNIGETSELRVMAEQLKDAMEQCLVYTGMYQGLEADSCGEIELGTAWAEQDTEKTEAINGQTIADLNARADLANKLEGILSQEEIRRLLFPEESEAENAQAVQEMANTKAVEDAKTMEKMKSATMPNHQPITNEA